VQKIKAVLDTNTVVSGLFWRGDAYKCLLALAQRKFFAVVSPVILVEYRRIAAEVQIKTGTEPMEFLDWLESKSESVDAIPIRKLSRDADDNIFVGCALASGAKFIVTRDKDLLDLEKPFGIEIVQPREFLRKLSNRT
jgi:putative PIN family toxin of toxin-antitoxin system